MMLLMFSKFCFIMIAILAQITLELVGLKSATFDLNYLTRMVLVHVRPEGLVGGVEEQAMLAGVAVWG